MRPSFLLIILAGLGFGSANAQSQSTIDKAAADGNGCLLMSDSLHVAFGLSEAQALQVLEADHRLLKACENVGYRDTGAIDQGAVRDHMAELEKVLTAEQFERWKAMCHPEPVKPSVIGVATD